MSTPSSPSRRRFLQASTASGLLILEPKTVFGSQANSTIELGIIGCGSRGIYISNFFLEHTQSKIVALAEPLPDHLDLFRKQVSASSARVYGGFRGYHELVESKLDAVIIESPPYFHPEHAAAAVTANKHVYLAKPIAVDVPGCQSIAESARKAQGKLSFMVDFQTRARPVFQELAKRVNQGDIGSPVFAQVQYHNGAHHADAASGDSPLLKRIRNWNLDRALSGDIIVEQGIHMIDVGNWLLGGHPLEAVGVGERAPNPTSADMQDMFMVRYLYPGGVNAEFVGSRFDHGFRDLGVRVHGSKGTAEAHYMGVMKIFGQKPWDGGDNDQTRLGALTNVENFVQSVQTGNYLNNSADAVSTNLTCILGRTAAYKRERVTWDELIRANEKLDAHLSM